MPERADEVAVAQEKDARHLEPVAVRDAAAVFRERDQTSPGDLRREELAGAFRGAPERAIELARRIADSRDVAESRLREALGGHRVGVNAHEH